MFKKLKYQGKIFITYSIVVVIIMTISTYLVQRYITDLLKNTEEEHLSELSRKTVEKMETILNKMDQASYKIASNRQVVKILTNIEAEDYANDNYFRTHTSDAGEIKNVIMESNGYQSLQDRISVVTRKGDFAKVDIFDNISPDKGYVLGREWVVRSLAMEQDRFLLKPHQDDWTEAERFCISYVRVIKSMIDMPIGLVEIQYPLEKFDVALELENATPISIVLLDANGDLFYEQIKRGIGLSADYLNKQQRTIEENGSPILYKEKIADENIIYNIRKIPDYGLSVVLIERESDFLTPVRRMTQAIFLVEGFILIFTLFMIYAVSKKLTKPLVDLRKSIEAFDLDTFSMDLQIDNKSNEMALLTSAFDLMLSKIRTTSSELVQARTRELKANYLALQSQVNPHFLHNVLTVIGTMGQQYGDHEILHMCSALTQMLSYSTSMKTGYSTIGKEMDHVTNYLKLMKYRYIDFLEYELSFEDELDSIIVPKLSILPIVENCFSHAFRNNRPPYTINIKGKIVENRWLIEVTDNGCGFSEDALENLNKKLESIKREFITHSYSPDLEMGGLGLLNTYARFRLYYSGQEHFEFSNISEGGGKVTISGLVDGFMDIGNIGGQIDD